MFTKLDAKYKRLDCIYEIWDKKQLLADDSEFATAIDDVQRVLIERHNVIVYASFLRSAKIWGALNDNILNLRKNQRPIKGGLQIASDFMPQGDLSIIPLTSTIGYQANSHVIVHFTDGDPDLGRKTFQPELTSLAEAISVHCVTVMKKYLPHLKPDTGNATITPDKELHEWRKKQEAYRDTNPLAFQFNGRQLAMISRPQQEQDVVALFHELIGLGVLQGFYFYATSQSDRYDCLFFMEFGVDSGCSYDGKNNRLGIRRDYGLPLTSEPKVLEYKYSLDSLVSDFDKEEKYAKQIDLAVCWSTGKGFREQLYLQSLLIDDEGSNRQIHGATHQAFLTGSQHPAFEVIVLDDLIRWLTSPANEEARQKQVYSGD